MFAWYLEDGHTLFGLAKHLQALQAPTPRGSPFWNLATLRGMLTNPTYRGQVYVGCTRARPAQGRRSATQLIGQSGRTHAAVAEAEWMPVAMIPAIVSAEQFARVQAKLAQNRQSARRNNTAHDYLLRALVSCGVCQSACIARTAHPGYAYYVCRGKADPVRTGREHICPARYVPAQQLDELVWHDLCEVLTHPELIAQALERAQGGQWLPHELQVRRENLRKGQMSLSQQVERLTAAYLGEVFPLGEYQRRRRELDQKREALAAQEQLLEAQVDRQAELAGWVSSMEDFCRRVKTV